VWADSNEASARAQRQREYDALILPRMGIRNQTSNAEGTGSCANVAIANDKATTTVES